MTRWTDTNRTDFDSQETIHRHGIVYKRMWSPYDIPYRIGGRYDAPSKQFEIHLIYAGSEEKTQRFKLSEHVDAISGSNSGRIYTLILDLSSIPRQSRESLNAITNLVDEAVEALRRGSATNDSRQKQRTDLNSTLLSRVKDNYLAEIAD